MIKTKVKTTSLLDLTQPDWLEQCSDFIGILDLDGTIIDINKTIGPPKETVIGFTFLSLVLRKKNYSINSLVTCKITEITNDGLNVKLEDGNKGFISKLNLAKEKNEQKTERFAIGEKIDSVIISFDQKSNFINLSVKQKEINEEKEALNQYGSSDSGASLGDILGKVLKKKK